MNKKTNIKLHAVCVVILTMVLIGISRGETLNESALVEPDLDNVSSGSLFLQMDNSYIDAPVHNASLDVLVTGIVSKIKLVQTFENTSTDWVEGLYVFPLPDQAAVNALTIKIGDREIIGSIQEKQEAIKQFEIAKNEGKIASIVKQQRPNLFTTRFANVPPGETISVSLSYIQTIQYENESYSLRVPLTLTPRYSNSLVSDADAITPSQFPLSSIDESAEQQIDINVKLIGSAVAENVSSPSHLISAMPVDNELSIELVEQTYLDRDFILEWTSGASDTPVVQTWYESVNDEGYLLATITPPLNEQSIPTQSRELILVVDTSGSMAGTSIKATKSALLKAIQGLRSNDSFNIIEFNSSYSALFDSPVLANIRNTDIAKRFAQRLTADGGTEMIGALHEAFSYDDTDQLRQIVLITDGSIGYEESVIESVKDNLGDARVFTVGIGSAPNQWFMRKVAEAGRGTFLYIPDINQVQKEMSQLLSKLETPALTDIKVTVNDGSADGSAEIVPNPIPDLYAYEPLVIAAKLSGQPTTLNVTGRWGNERFSQSANIRTQAEISSGLSTVWARKKIESLEDKQRFHSDPDYYRSLILRLGLDHQILSRYTAFLAVEQTPTRPIGEPLAKKNVPNLLPAGFETQRITLPQGAAGIDTLMVIGLLSLLLSLCVHYWIPSSKRGALS